MNENEFERLLRSRADDKEQATLCQIGDKLRKRLTHYFETNNITKKINLLKPMKKTYSKTMRMLLGAMIIFVISGATLLAQDQITDPINLDLTTVSTVTFGDQLMSPPLPLPTDDFSQPDFQSQMVEANRSAFQNNAGAIMPPSPLSSSFSIQPAPEPSTFALGSLAIGLIALVRLSRRQQILNR